jgi:hypothetical protein
MLTFAFASAAPGFAAPDAQTAQADEDDDHSSNSVAPFVSFIPIWVAIFAIYSGPTFPVSQVLAIVRSKAAAEKKATSLRSFVSARFVASDGFRRLVDFQPPKKERIKADKVGAVHRVTVAFRDGPTYVLIVRKRDKATDGKGAPYLIDEISGGEFDE